MTTGCFESKLVLASMQVDKVEWSTYWWDSLSERAVAWASAWH